MTQEYDKSILKWADSLIEGQPEGRISEHEMEELLKLEYNTSVQINSLLYIVNTYKLTESARKKFLESLRVVIAGEYAAPHSPRRSREEINDDLNTEIEKLNIEIAYLKKESGHVGGQ